MRKIFSTFALVLVAFSRLPAYQPSFDSGPQPIPTLTIVSSKPIFVRTSEVLTVTGEARGDPEFNFSTSVYGVDRMLVAKENTDVTADAFRWTPPRDGKYYVVLRNASPVSGTYRLTVSPAETRGEPGPVADFAIVKIFYATNREKTGDLKPSNFFGSEPTAGDGLVFGTCEVSIPREHRMGELESPSIWKLEFRADPAKHVILERVIDEDRDNFFKQVSARAQNSMHREAFVFVHGFDNTFEGAVRRTAQMAYDLAFDGAAILYSWPSQGKMDLVNYNRDGRNAELSAAPLKSFLEQLAIRSRATTIHVIAHSMGNRVLAASLQEIARTKKPHFRQIALMAPDIDAMVFQKMAGAIGQTADRVTLYASSRDMALLASERFNGYRRAGEGGQKILVVPGIDTVDASSVDTSLLGALHQYYADNQAILGDLFHLLRGEAPQSRFRLRNVHSAVGDYWLFEPTAR